MSIQSSAEHDFVAQLTQYNVSFWIGLNDADGPAEYHREGFFKWTDGNPFVEEHSYSRWKDGEPSNHKHLDCIRSDAEGWSVARGGCASTKLPYVCEMNGTYVRTSLKYNDIITCLYQCSMPIRIGMEWRGLCQCWSESAALFFATSVLHGCRAGQY